MDNRQTKPMVEGGILAGVSALMVMLSLVPLVGIVAKFLCPLPVIILGVRHGMRSAVLTAVVVTLLAGLMISPLYALFVLPGFFLVSMSLAYTYRKNFGAVKAVFLASGAAILAKIIMIAAMLLLFDMNPWGGGVDKLFEEMMTFYREAGISGDEMQKLEDMLKQALDLTKVLAPTAVIAASIFEGFLNFVVAGALLRRLSDIEIPAFPAFRLWKFPKEVVYFYVLALIGLYWGTTYSWIMLTNASTNLWMITTLITLLQGAALFVWFAYKYNLSKTVQGIILFLVLINGTFAQILSMAGVFDILFDYRKRFGDR